MQNSLIYLDNNSTTPVDPEVLEAMIPYFNREFGNPSSIGHIIGKKANAAVENARESIATILGTGVTQILFTAGTTEANNLLLLGLAQNSDKKHIITCTTEHSSVLNPARLLEKRGYRVSYIKTDKNGLIDFTELTNSISEDTLLISVMHANNEIGVIQDIRRIGELAKCQNILFHSDIAQSIGKIDFSFHSIPADFVTFGAHKIYGPKGIGVLAINNRIRKSILSPIMVGGGQEAGLRPGTLNTPLIVGLSKALEIAIRDKEKILQRINKLTEKLKTCFLSFKNNIRLNGDPVARVPGNLNFLLKNIEIPRFMKLAGNICISSGSACSSGSAEPSHVLRSIGLTSEEARSSVRIGVGKFNTEEEIDFTCKTFSEILHRLLY